MKKYIIFYGFILSLLLPCKAIASSLVWSETTALPFQISSQISEIINNRIYTVGGSASTGESRYDTFSSQINSNGTLTQWTKEDKELPIAPIWHTGSKLNNHLYILGGYEENNNSSHTYINRVFLGNINESGVLDNWFEQNSLPNQLGLGGSVVVNNNLYFLGGRNNNGIYKDVYVSSINEDGSLNSWTTAGQLPEELYSMGAVATHGKIIVLGGNIWSNATTDKVYGASLNGDGTIQTWTEYPSLPKPLSRPGVTVIRDYLVVAGGYSPDGGFQSAVYYAKINNDGTISNWKLSKSVLPRNNCCSPLVSNNDYLYLIGGHDGDYYSEVLMSPFSSVVNEDLNVPLIKQTDLPWAGDIYDTATKWDPVDPSIAVWGCALTSAAMVFNFHGINKLPDSTWITPRTLNNWLKSQPDGYVRNGLVNWLALARLSKQAKFSGYNAGFAYDALEFSKVYTNRVNLLKSDLQNNIPGILELPGHFVVAKGISDNTFSINDPYASFTTLEDGYNNSFISLNRFVPSFTDLSYIQILGNNNLLFNLSNASENQIGEESDQTPLINEQDPLKKSGETLHTLLYKNPATDIYTLNITSPQATHYEIDIYLYDSEGQPKLLNLLGFTNQQGDNIIINYNHDNEQLSDISKYVTYQSFIKDIQIALSLKLIDKGYATSLISLLKSAEKSKNTTQQKSILTGILRTLELSKGKKITTEAYDILKQNDQILLEQIN